LDRPPRSGAWSKEQRRVQQDLIGQQLIGQPLDRAVMLAGYRIVDTAPEPAFDDLVYLAADICEAPISVISLIDERRQWFKARVGVEVCETDISESVCVHGLAEPGPLLIINDLKRDPRTADNPVVSGKPPMRFYAGAPLRTSYGDVLGMLCIADHYPRPMGLTQRQTRALIALGRQATISIELNRLAHDRVPTLPN
jgi:GAF domain-containing protein